MQYTLQITNNTTTKYSNNWIIYINSDADYDTDDGYKEPHDDAYDKTTMFTY